MMRSFRFGNIDSAPAPGRTGGPVTATDDRIRRFDAWLALSRPGADFAGTVSLPMLTGSMAPAVPRGARLQIASARRHPFGVGDVVVFERQGRLVAHRLLFALGFGPGTLYLEKGDWNATGGLIRRRDVRGVVVGWLPADDAAGTPVAVPGSRRAAAISFLRSFQALWRGRRGA